MIDLKPYGAFVEYTIRPLLEEMNKFGFKYSDELMSKLVELYKVSKLVEIFITIFTTLIICITAYLIAK